MDVKNIIATELNKGEYIKFNNVNEVNYIIDILKHKYPDILQSQMNIPAHKHRVDMIKKNQECGAMVLISPDWIEDRVFEIEIGSYVPDKTVDFSDVVF